MWLRRAISVCVSAYLGGLAALYLLQVYKPQDNPTTLDGRSYGFALFLLCFTIPGVIMVASAYSELSTRHSIAVSYALAILIGGLVGGLVLWILEPSLALFGVGTLFGFVTASIWAAYNRFVSTTF